MLFQHVAIAGLAHIDAPRRLTSVEINARLRPTMERLGIKTDVLGEIAGIHSRFLWEDNVLASDVATLAASSPRRCGDPARWRMRKMKAMCWRWGCGAGVRVR